MEALKYKIKDITEKGYPVKETVKVSELQPEGVQSLPIEEISIEGLMTKVGHNFLFTGIIEGMYIHLCDRCLGEARYKLRKEILWLFEKGICDEYLNVIVKKGNVSETKKSKQKEREEFDELAEKRVYQGDEIDLSPYVWEELVLDTPYKFLCKENCAGLCYVCGKNLNYESCNCNKQQDTIGEVVNTKLSELLQTVNLKLKEE
ncbi:MAG: DUF177 domain-containing protein [Candidatus Hydrogenedentes bacterium]|nr:DUF177 domain-containing protein [Candidatus Hydrogenedentota bacterium]